MTSMVLGTVGGIIGATLGGPVGAQAGFLLGSLLGNLIDPPKVEGPRRTDLKLQTSEYGKMWPYVWGTGRIAGNVIDQTDLVEHKQKSGGKGGPQVITYTYSASFLVALAAAKRFGDPAILGILRIWADGRLIWDSNSGEEMPCTLYLGTEDQDPDPTFEAIHGVGQQPAYRGLAYVAFADYYLTDFGDRIPVLEFEVYTNIGDFPYRVSTFNPMPDGVPAVGDRSYEYSGGRIVVGNYKTASLANGHYYERVFDLDGVEDTSAAYDREVYLPGFPSNPVHGLTAATDGTSWWCKENLITTITVNPFGGPVLEMGVGSSQVIIYHEGYIYGTGANTATGDIGIARYPASGGVITAETGTPDVSIVVAAAGSGTPLSNWVLGTSNRTDYIYLFHNGDNILYEYTGTLSGINRQWDLSSQNAIQDIVNGHAFAVYENSNGDLILACDRGTAGNKNTGVFYLNDNLTSTYIGNVPNATGYSGPVDLLGDSPYALVNDGVISLAPPAIAVPLNEVVDDLSSMSSLQSGVGSPASDAYDTTELASDDVRWYAVGTQTTIRNALDPLRKGFFFDAVETDYRIVFKKRGATDSLVTIDDDDLIAREDGETSGDPLVTTRKREFGMPRTVTMRYIDVEMDYQTGAQNSPRLTTLSDSDVALDLPIGFTSSEALQKCWSLQVAEWIERESFTFSTTRKYDWLQPCDVCTVRGRVIRITAKTAKPSGVIEWEGVLHRPSIYTQAQSSSGSSGFIEQTGSTDVVPTECVLLDIPILSQDHAPFGFYAAMGPSRAGAWPGATLYKSIDGGVTYLPVASSVEPSIIGVTSSDADTGSPNATGVLSSHSGDTVEEASLCLSLTDVDAELESINSTGLENGGNLCAISRETGGSPRETEWELLNFRDVSAVASGVDVISGFLRGRKNTLTTGHADGDRFVFLPVTNVDAPESELNHEYRYKAVTFGKTLAETPYFLFTNTGLSAEQYYETEAEHLPVYGENSSGSPAQLTPGLVPPPHGSGCDPDYFLNECGEWAIPAGGGGGGSPSGGGATNLTMPSGFNVSGSGTDTITVTGGPAAQFIVMAPDADLPNELVATSNGNITVTAPGGSPSGQVVWDLTTTGATPGGYGSSNDIPIIYVDAYGRVTSITSTPLVGRIITEYEHSVIDTQCLALNFTGAAFAYDEGGGVTGVHVPYSAPIDGPFVLAASMGSPNLTGARVLTAGSGISITDNGPGGSIVIAGTVSAGGRSQAQEFTSDGTFTVPDGVSVVMLTMIGGGGGGSSRNAAAQGGGGGGSGEICVRFPVVVEASSGSPSNTIAITIGAAGTGAVGAGSTVAGGDGGTTSFGSLFSVLGGKGGTTGGVGGAGGGSNPGAGGAAGNPGAVGALGSVESAVHFGGSGGSGGGSTTTANGGAGRAGPGYSTGTAGGIAGGAQAGGGSGAGTLWGLGGAGGAGGAVGSAPASTAYGAGGGGAGGKATTGANGGDGAKGYCLVEWIA